MGESPRVCCQLAAHRRTPPTSNNTASAIAPAIGRAGTGVRSATIEELVGRRARVAGAVLRRAGRDVHRYGAGGRGRDRSRNPPSSTGQAAPRGSPGMGMRLAVERNGKGVPRAVSRGSVSFRRQRARGPGSPGAAGRGRKAALPMSRSQTAASRRSGFPTVRP